uniref:Cyclin-like domain-containing protein n=2 Tax=Denticeps clupeoides TaxID=299321 RepID=A0AAY4CJS0_9TELE
MAAGYRGSPKWLFTREQLENTPSRRSGIEPDRELSYRQQAANLIQDMGQRLNVSQLTINTAIVYMHRFYMLHSFIKFHRNIISPTTLFLAAKVEEQPRKLEHVIKVAHACLNPQDPPLDTKSNAYLQQAQELVLLETIVLQTLGFEITIEHPHTDVVRCSQLVRASKDLAQTSYFMATNSLHLTTFCLQHKPTVVACVCIHLACKWSNWEIPISSDGKHWWEYVDRTVTLQLLDQLTHEFLQILEKTPSKLKRIRNWRATQAAKKTKTDPTTVETSFQAPCLTKDNSLDCILDISGRNIYSDASSSFSLDLPSSSAASLAINGMVTLPGSAYPFPAASSSQQEVFGLKPEGVPMQLQQPLPPPTNHTQKLSLDKYREKQAAELAMRRLEQSGEVDIREVEQHRKRVHHHNLQSATGSSGGDGSSVRVKYAQSGSESSKSFKSGSVKRRLPPSENGSASQEELRMKIKVSAERHAASGYGALDGAAGGSSAGKSKHASPRQSKEKHRDHSGHRLSKHGHAHSTSLIAGHADPASTGHHQQHHHSAKSSRSSKSSGGSSHRSGVVQQEALSQGPGLSAAFPASALTHPLSYGSLSTLVKADKKPAEGHAPDAMLALNGQHMDYEDTFNMLDSLLSAQQMNY